MVASPDTYILLGLALVQIALLVHGAYRLGELGRWAKDIHRRVAHLERTKIT